jgi:GYF domain 2
MATYTIIGGDQKEYGPVTAEEVRKWIAEGRLNAQSLMKAESDAEWRPLSVFPEFADAFGGPAAASSTPPPLTAAGGGEYEAALKKIKGPATGLIVTAIINLILGIYSLMRMIFSPPDMQELDSTLKQLNNPQLQDMMHRLFHLAYGPIGMANVLIGLIMSTLILIGAKKMQSLRSYEFAFTAAVLSVIPCLTPCCGYVIGLGFGIWALVVMRKPEVKSQFH